MTSYKISTVLENSWIESHKTPEKAVFFPTRTNMKRGTKILGKGKNISVYIWGM